jgi:hypothetical protein
MRLRWLVIAAAALALPALPAAARDLAGPRLDAEQRAQLLAEALSTYDGAIAMLRADPARARETFRSAAEKLQMLVDDGVVNGRLQYDLGNAWLQAGDLGRAILSYRRAEQLIPGDARLESNLRYARSLCRTQIQPSGGRALGEALLAWHERTPQALRLWVFTAAWLGFWGALAAAVLVPASWWRWAAVLLAPLWIACGASVAADWLAPPGASAGVIVADQVVVRMGNGEGYEPRFAEPLHQGVEFTLREERGGWRHVELADGSSGWIRSDQSELVAS